MSRQWESKKESSDINTRFINAGDSVEGTFTGFLEDQGKDKNSFVYTLKQDDGEEKRFWGTKVLDDQMSKVNIGAYVKVEFKGKVKSKAGREYNDFELFEDTSVEPINVEAPAATKTAPVAVEEDDSDPF